MQPKRRSFKYKYQKHKKYDSKNINFFYFMGFQILKCILGYNKHDNLQQILDSCIFCLDKEGL